MPAPLTLKQRLAALSVAQSSSSSNSGDYPASPISPTGFNTARRKGGQIWSKVKQTGGDVFNGRQLGSAQRTTPTDHGSSYGSGPSVGRLGLGALNAGGSTHAHGGQWERSKMSDMGMRINEVMSRMIFQAGVDYETRPMVVLCASALPDPKHVDYDLLLSRVMAYLNLYVEADYTVVFFAAGGRNTPGWNWVWKAYRSLSRTYRKNLKQLYIVHSTFFTKMLFSLAGAIISPKFFRKLVYVDTLSELALRVPLTQIDIPPAVYEENLTREARITLPVPSRSSSVFGVPLDEIMGFDGEKGGIPRVVRDCIAFVRDYGMQEEGLFRRSVREGMLREVKDAYDRGHVVSLETFGDPHLAAVLLKKYLRDLPEPIFPERLYPLIRRCPIPTSEPGGENASVRYLRESLLPELAPCVYILLSVVLHLLHDVSLRVAQNRMDAHNLSIVISPNLVKSPNPMKDVLMCMIPNGASLLPDQPEATNPEGRATLGLVMKICIERYYEVFDEVLDRSDAIDPRTRQGLSLSAEASVSPSPSTSTLPSHSESGVNPFTIHNGHDEEDELDDDMLVMPIGPTKLGHRPTNSNASSGSNVPVAGSKSPPSAWGAPSSVGSGTPTGTYGTVKARGKTHRTQLSGSSTSSSLVGARVKQFSSSGSHGSLSNLAPAGGSGPTSLISGGGSSAGTSNYAYASMSKSKARSMISIEGGSPSSYGPLGKGGKKGSISIGRGTLKGAPAGTIKSGGAGVEAIGVTAAGFFSPPRASSNGGSVGSEPRESS